MSFDSNRRSRFSAWVICLLFSSVSIGCHQLSPRPVATYSQPPAYQYAPTTPSYNTPSPDPAYGSPTPVDPNYGAARPVTPTLPRAAQPSLSGRPAESYNRRVPTPVEPPEESSPSSNSFVGPVLTPPTDLEDSDAESGSSNSFLDSLGSTEPPDYPSRRPVEPKTKPAELELSVRVPETQQSVHVLEVCMM